MPAVGRDGPGLSIDVRPGREGSCEPAGDRLTRSSTRRLWKDYGPTPYVTHSNLRRRKADGELANVYYTRFSMSVILRPPRSVTASTAKAIVRRYPRQACQESGSASKPLVEKGKATDHGAAPVRWAGSAFARHNPAGPMEETSMS
jgi:hypothetical protein